MLNKIFLVMALTGIALTEGFSQDSLRVKVDSVVRNTDISSLIPDTTKKETSKLKAFGNTMAKVVGAKTFEPDEKPRIVFIRSLFVPGAGQISNGQYLKVPLVYVAAGASIYYIGRFTRQYNRYVNILEDMKTKGLNEIDIDGKGPYTKEGITSGANQVRRYRDLNIIGFAVGWVLFAVEANVAAHLKTFDMSEDISYKISPSLQSGPMSASLGVKVEFNIK